MTTTPIDWSDLQIRLRETDHLVRRLTVEVEALRELTVEQALEIKRLKEENHGLSGSRTEAMPRPVPPRAGR